MIVIFGSNTYGRIDSIPGLGYVATEFFHLYYLPLIPYRTRFVVRKDAGGFEGGNLPLSFKSILTAWVRTASLLVLLLVVTLGLFNLTDNRVDFRERFFWCLGMAVIGLVVLWLHYGLFKVASYSNAMALADQLAMDPRLRIYIDMQYERISEQEAEKRLDALGYSSNELDDLTDELAQTGLSERYESR